jgi:hypothetical protein
MMRVRILLLAALLALAVPAATLAKQGRSKHHGGSPENHGRSSQIVGTWSVQVTVKVPPGQPTFPALLTFSPGGGVVETESDAPGTGLGSWEKIGDHQYQFAFETFIFDNKGQPGGHVIVRNQVTVNGDTASGPFKFDVFDPTGKIVQSGSGTATATRFQIPPF